MQISALENFIDTPIHADNQPMHKIKMLHHYVMQNFHIFLHLCAELYHRVTDMSHAQRQMPKMSKPAVDVGSITGYLLIKRQIQSMAMHAKYALCGDSSF